MPAKHSRHIALTDSLTAWIDSQVAKGECTSTSDFIRTAVLMLRAQEADGAAPGRQGSTRQLSPGRGRA